MALYYETKDRVKGQLLDELAKERLGDWDPSVGNIILERISSIFPSIEKILPIDSKMLVGESEGAKQNRRLFKEAAGLMYDFINRKNIPPSLVATIADTPQIQNKGKRFNRIFTYIDTIAARTELDKNGLYSALEELVRKTGSFVDLERVASRYNLFFASAEVLPEYTEMVAGLVGSGWKTDTVADLVAVTYQHLLGKQAAEAEIDIAEKAKIVGVRYSATDFERNKKIAEIEEKWEGLKKEEGKTARKAHLGSLRQLVQSLAEEDLELLTREVSLLPPPQSMAGAGEKRQAYTTDVAIKATGPRTLSLGKLEKEAIRFGLFLGLAGLLNREYEFNDVVSTVGITKTIDKEVTDGTFLVFNHGEERLTLKLVKGDDKEPGSIEVEGLAPEELRLLMLDLQKAGTYVAAVYDAIDILGSLPHGKKRLRCWNADDGNAIQYLSPQMSCQIKDINLQQRTANYVFITVNAEEKVRLYEALKQIGLDAKFEFYAEMKETGLVLELVLKGIPSATQQPMQDEKFAGEKKTLQNMLAAVDEYTTSDAGGAGSNSLVDFLCYLNRSADRKKLPELLSHGEGVLQRIGPLFVYPQTFGKNFELLTRLEQKTAVSVLYAVEPTNELSAAREWLNKYHSDLAADIGVDEV